MATPPSWAHPISPVPGWAAKAPRMIEAKPKKVSFGRDGKPCLVLRKGESLSGAQRRLERNFEPGEYTVEEGESLR